MIQVDVWAGECHMEYAGRRFFTDWPSTSFFIEEMVETGFLCNILHTDFIAPPDVVKQESQNLYNTLKEMGNIV